MINTAPHNAAAGLAREEWNRPQLPSSATLLCSASGRRRVAHYAGLRPDRIDARLAWNYGKNYGPYSGLRREAYLGMLVDTSLDNNRQRRRQASWRSKTVLSRNRGAVPSGTAGELSLYV